MKSKIILTIAIVITGISTSVAQNTMTAQEAATKIAPGTAVPYYETTEVT